MVLRETRYKKIMDKLSENDSYYSAKNIADSLDVSVKTVRNAIKELNHIIEQHGAEIESKANAGYKLCIIDKNVFESFLVTSWHNYAFIKDDYNDPEFRKMILLETLLSFSGFVEMNILTDKLNVSEYTLVSDIKQIKLLLQTYDLKLLMREKEGIMVQGLESNKRKCLVHILNKVCEVDIMLLNKDDTNFLKDYGEIMQIVNHYLRIYGYDINQLVFKNLILHIYIMIRRVKEGISIRNDEWEHAIDNDCEEMNISKKILNEIGLKFNVDFSTEEMIYVARHLIEKHQFDEKGNRTVSIGTNEVVKEMLVRIKNTMKYDFLENLDLRISLGLHVEQLIERMKYRLYLKNPLLEEIKKNFLAYEIATIAYKSICDLFNTEANEDEIGYLALYFAGELEKKRRLDSKKNIAIVCGSGRATSNLVKESFLNEFSSQCGNLDILNNSMLASTNLEKYDLIVSTIPINIETNTPIIEVSPLMNWNDINSIKLEIDSTKEQNIVYQIFDPQLYFTEYECESKIDFIQKISKQIEEKQLINGNLAQEILDRENIFPTEFENKVVLLHPLHPVSEKTFASVSILKEPMHWDLKEIQLVIVFSLGQKDSLPLKEFYNLLSQTLRNSKKVNKLIKCLSLYDFINILLKEDIN